MVAFFQRFRQTRRRTFKHRATHLRAAVFEREIIMPAGGTGQIGHFARNPQTGKMVFQQGFSEGVEFGYGNGGGCEEFGHWGWEERERLDYKGFRAVFIADRLVLYNLQSNISRPPKCPNSIKSSNTIGNAPIRFYLSCSNPYPNCLPKLRQNGAMISFQVV